jgi:hypothetical protein
MAASPTPSTASAKAWPLTKRPRHLLLLARTDNNRNTHPNTAAKALTTISLDICTKTGVILLVATIAMRRETKAKRELE